MYDISGLQYTLLVWFFKGVVQILSEECYHCVYLRCPPKRFAKRTNKQQKQSICGCFCLASSVKVAGFLTLAGSCCGLSFSFLGVWAKGSP